MGNDKKEEFKQEWMLGVVAKIPISITFSELTGVDFADYSDYEAFYTFGVHFRDSHP